MTWEYRGLQGVTRGYKELQGVTRGYRGLQEVTGGENFDQNNGLTAFQNFSFSVVINSCFYSL